MKKGVLFFCILSLTMVSNLWSTKGQVDSISNVQGSGHAIHNAELLARQDVERSQNSNVHLELLHQPPHKPTTQAKIACGVVLVTVSVCLGAYVHMS